MPGIAPVSLSTAHRLCALASLMWQTQGSVFRGGDVRNSNGVMSAQDARAVMLQELLAALGGSNKVNEQRLSKIEDALRPTFFSMQKNEKGNLDHAAVRYVLHRFFVHRHGMYIKGLEPDGQAWNVSSPTDALGLQEGLSSYVQSIFEDRLRGKGLGVHELAILAATLEHLIHDEAVKKLHMAYSVNYLSTEETLSHQQAEAVIDAYMFIFFMGQRIPTMTEDMIRQYQPKIERFFPSWNESRSFAQGVLNDVSASVDLAAANGLTFETTARVVDEIGEQYGQWQHRECQGFKHELMKRADVGTGRVRMQRFYQARLSGEAFQFSESVEYLRDNGVLDEHDPEDAKVIIPNYVVSPSNCLGSSSIFSICCLNECEVLLGHLEREIAGPDAKPDRIIELVMGLPSETVTAPRSISNDLKDRLDEIASHHDGVIPLHGRLFAQWMHHAYPLECPYPQASGTTNPMTPDAWVRENGVSWTESKESMLKFAASPENVEKATAMPWTAHEELVVPRPDAVANGWRSFLRRAAALVVMMSASVIIKRLLLSASSTEKRSGSYALPFAGKQHSC